MRSRTYEITFEGRAGAGLRAEFDDCEVLVGSSTTTLRVELPDQAALVGLMLRIIGRRLDVIQVRLVKPPNPGDAAKGWRLRRRGHRTWGSQASALSRRHHQSSSGQRTTRAVTVAGH